MDETFDVLPLYNDNTLKRREMTRLTLGNNPELNEKWEEYLKSRLYYKSIPMLLPMSQDMHFYMHRVQLVPSENIDKHVDCGMKLVAKIDFNEKGRIPYPSDMYYRRSDTSQTTKSNTK